jgi:hypothetical protein
MLKRENLRNIGKATLPEKGAPDCHARLIADRPYATGAN